MNLYQKINQVMLEVESVAKGVTIKMSGGQYSAVSHDDVTRLLHLPVAKIGIVLVPSVVKTEMQILEKSKEWQGKVQTSKEYMASVTVKVTAINADEPSERIEVKMPAIAFDSSDKAFGKAISMATKYAYLKLFMLDSFDEEEQRQDAHYEKKSPPSGLENNSYPKNVNQQKFAMEEKKTLTQTAKEEAALIELIKQKMGDATKGMDLPQKNQYMQSKVGIKSFGEIYNKSQQQLNDILAKL